MVNLFGWVTGRQFTKGLSTVLIGLALVSCGDTDGPPKDLFGVAATGAATQGTVSVIGADGVELSQSINVDGTFKFDVRKLAAPFMLKTVADNGIPDLFSYAADANVTVNVTPLTNLTVFIANGNADLGILYDSWVSAFGNIDATSIKNAQATVNANLSTQYTAFSLDPQTYDFIGTRFTTNNTGIDDLLDVLTVDISAGISISIVGIVGVFPYDPDIDITDFNIGDTAVAVTGNYSLSRSTSIDTVIQDNILLSVNLPVASVPTVPTGNTQIIEDTFLSYYGSVGTIVVNSTAATNDDITPTTVIAVIDASITTPESVVNNYVATYTYTLNP